MKILQINKFYYLKGGSERYLFELSKILKEKGHEVIPFAMKDERNEPTAYSNYFAEKVRVEKFSFRDVFKFFYNREAAKKLEKLLKKEKPDIAHLHNIAHQLSPAVIAVLKKQHIPVIMTLHDYKLICPNYQLFSQNEICDRCRGGKYYNCLTRRCLKNSRLKSFLAMLEAYFHNKILKTYDKVDLFIAPSQFMKDTGARFGIPAEKIKVIYNFTEISDEKGESGDYLLYFGRLSKEKGVDVLLKALKKAGDVKLKIVGDGPEKMNYESAIRNYDLADRVEMLGAKYGQELENLISKARAVVMPSVWPENMPLSLLEAMAAGKAIIASRVGGLSELIKDGENGFLFSAGASNELAAIFERIKKADLEKMGERARETVRPLNKEAHYIKIMEIYRQFSSS